MFKTSDGIVVYTRSDWGARKPRAAYGQLGELRSVVYHHGGPVGKPRMTKRAAAATLRSWQAYHMDSNGWADIGYHAAMDGKGRLYLGRPAWALGAHVFKENTGRFGLVFLQDGRYHGLTDPQERTVRKLFRVRHDRLRLPALKTLARHDGADWGVFGHREVPGQATECPGDLIAFDLKQIIKEWTR